MSTAEDLFTPVFRRLYDCYRDQPRVSAIRRITSVLTADQFETEIIPAGYPVLFSEYGRSTNCRDSLIDLLRVLAGNVEIETRSGTFASPAECLYDRRLEKTTIADYLQALSSSDGRPARYIGNQRLPDTVAHALRAEPPDFVDAEDLEPPAFWLGPAQATTPLHKDSTDNFAIHLFGAKRWYLFRVGDAPRLRYRRPQTDPSFDFAVSEIADTDPTREDFAAVTGVQPLTVDVAAGEILYLPAGWGHHVVNLETCLMVNYWYSRAAFAWRWSRS